MGAIWKDARGFLFSTMNIQSVDYCFAQPMHYDTSTIDRGSISSVQVIVLINVSYCERFKSNHNAGHLVWINDIFVNFGFLPVLFNIMLNNFRIIEYSLKIVADSFINLFTSWFKYPDFLWEAHGYNITTKCMLYECLFYSDKLDFSNICRMVQ